MTKGKSTTRTIHSERGIGKIGQFRWMGIGTVTVALLLMFVTRFSDPVPLEIFGFVFSRLTCLLGVLVTLIGAVVVKFSDRYLDGDPQQNSFINLLTLTVMSALCMMLADNILLLIIGWAVTSTGLHFLLTHYKFELDALLVARKKFMISRLGDVSLILACWLIYREWGTLSLSYLFDQFQVPHHPPVLVAWLVGFAAISKSAQFPFHSWLPDTLASPTPVSALMHAGIINGGGVLLLKFAPALIEVPSAGLFLSVIGSITMSIGLLSMWSQTSIKRKLAWSTVSQMGFMTAEIGMFAFVPALVHILSHGLYKATAFLESGVIDQPFPKPNAITSWSNLALLCFGWLVSIPVQVLVHSGPIQARDWALIAMTGLGAGHTVIAIFSSLKQIRVNFAVGWTAMIAASQLVAALSAITLRLSAIVMNLPTSSYSSVTAISCAIPVTTLWILSIYRAIEPSFRSSLFGMKLFVHAQNGFYIGLRADQLVAKIWKPFTTKAI